MKQKAHMIKQTIPHEKKEDEEIGNEANNEHFGELGGVLEYALSFCGEAQGLGYHLFVIV